MFESFNVLKQEPMSAHTTLKLGGPADYLAFPGKDRTWLMLVVWGTEGTDALTVVDYISGLQMAVGQL